MNDTLNAIRGIIHRRFCFAPNTSSRDERDGEHAATPVYPFLTTEIDTANASLQVFVKRGCKMRPEKVAPATGDSLGVFHYHDTHHFPLCDYGY